MALNRGGHEEIGAMKARSTAIVALDILAVEVAADPPAPAGLPHWRLESLWQGVEPRAILHLVRRRKRSGHRPPLDHRRLEDAGL
jgi:hypothetical protein